MGRRIKKVCWTNSLKWASSVFKFRTCCYETHAKNTYFCPWLKAGVKKAIIKSALLGRENSNFLGERLGQEVFCLFQEEELHSCQTADYAVRVFLGSRYMFITSTSQGWYFISSRVRRCVVNIVGVLEKVLQD